MAELGGAGPVAEVVVSERLLRRPQTLGGIVYLLVAAATTVGLALTVAGAWRTGLIWVGGGLLAGAVARLFLTDNQAGMLGVRRKLVDVTFMVLLGGALVTLSVVVPAAAI